ncbi:carboxypeptidase regulatory-like domain-containing protein [Aquisphaera insulae]|uniref:carboxypeptidase regulatory-like domain-containing protein n=1 Tax=Aquisphaera insulae TaxID=2712864 RepID=UPI0013ED3D18|nr:carboxypeptidase regulatory-like domain-containing protein [Aquisphaera insulae]
MNARSRTRCRGWNRKVVWLVAVAMAAAGARAGARAEEPVRRAPVSGTIVDEAGKAVAGATIDVRSFEKADSATSAGDGSFRVLLPERGNGRLSACLVARAGDGRLGLQIVAGEAATIAPAKVVLRPPHPLEVRVVDGGGRPVPQAEIHVQAGYEGILSGRSDEAGRWTVDVPADLTRWGVYALKSKVGFDYAQARRARNSAEALRPLPDRLTLTLDGARPPLRFRAVDRDGKPIAGILAGPWYFTKPDHEAEINGLTDVFRTTDADGVAVFDWLPAKVHGRLNISVHSMDFFTPDHFVPVPEDAAGDTITATFLPFERLSGRVTTADGRPAAGAIVRLKGQGSGLNGFQGETRTGDDGRYAIRVHTEEAYVLTASRDDLAAPYRFGVVVRPGKPADGLDFILGPGTRLKGRVTVGKDRKPAPDVNLGVIIERGSIPDELKKPGNRIRRGMSLWTWARTDADGRYEFLVGPGEYRIQGPPRVEGGTLTIPATNAPREIVRDYAMPRAELAPFAISVVDEAGKPVPGARIDGAYQSMTGYFTPTRADAAGKVRINRSLDPLVLMAETPDRARCGILRMGEEAAEATITVKPAAFAEGRLTDPGGKPLAGLTLDYGVRIVLSGERNAPFSRRFGGSATTGPDGRFRLEGLVVGERYELIMSQEDGHLFVRASTDVKPTGPGLVALNDVSVDLTPPKPYVPPTPAERAAQSFAARKEKLAKVRTEETLAEAKREYTRPLLLLGDPKDPACTELFRLFQETSTVSDAKKDEPRAKTPGDLRWEFELASFDASHEDVKSLARELGEPTDTAGPTLVVLTDEGKPKARYPLRLGPDHKLDARPLVAFLQDQTLPTRDAQASLADALSRAKAGDRRVILILSASWCGPCRMLARLLDAHKAELSPHVEIVKLDVSRDLHIREIQDRYLGKDRSTGIPWYVILDPAGKPLISSNAPGSEDEPSNIGFPTTAPDIDHFLSILRQATPGLSPPALEAIRKDLEKPR